MATTCLTADWLAATGDLPLATGWMFRCMEFGVTTQLIAGIFIENYPHHQGTGHWRLFL